VSLKQAGAQDSRSRVDAEDKPMIEPPCSLGFQMMWSILLTFKNSKS